MIKVNRLFKDCYLILKNFPLVNINILSYSQYDVMP